MSEQIRIERDGPIATIVLDRADKANAMTRAMWRDLGAAATALSADDAVRCIVIRGAGDKAFCPGADIGEFASERSNKAQAIEYAHAIRATIDGLQQCRHPLVAQIQGVCIGGGLLIASLCDLRICGESSRFGVPVKNLGLVEAYDELAPLVRLAGPAVTLEILLEGRIFGAAEARDKGLVTRVVADAQVPAEASAAAARIADGAPQAARWHKKFVRRLCESPPVSQAEHDECFDCFDTEDFRIGYQAFLAKRKPEFSGR
ncbi:MAG TPA: enoyl-CoA hydratase-related protein [Burkholderiaceae bacterium]|jgi:enoyl-CoA hydratase|nr:enoyl-CoA hydratase-related protein [Burkholderiaceae bacterium]